MNGINENKKAMFLILLSVMFLIQSFHWFAFASITLFLIILGKSHNLDVDLGDLILFYASYCFVLGSVGNIPWAFCRALGLVGVYQLGKRATDSDMNISPAFVVAPALALGAKGLLDYSLLPKEGLDDAVLYWNDWGGNILARDEHEYYLVLIASLLIYFVFYTVKVNLIGILGILASLGAVILAVYAKGRLAFWACLISAIIICISIVIENGIYRLKTFRITGASLLAIITVVITLFATNTFGLHDKYVDSMWAREGGPIFNERFDMMSQQVGLFFKSWNNNTEAEEDEEESDEDDDPALINSNGEEIYSVSNSWLETGRDKGTYAMLWMIAFSIHNVFCLIKAWKYCIDMNKYVVFSAFIGITFLNMVEPAIMNNPVFWALEVYLAGMVRALYNRACSPKTWAADITLDYV